ncbi:hypothetical protein ACFWC5_00310 [Streptomyces sp. NPDC060085]|uniref:hypothetical protein n=1 Tax=Streptomyces sp. NPDC060085 TaxID=3347054 RepID=UPI003653B52B
MQITEGALREIKGVTVCTIATEGEKHDPGGDDEGTGPSSTSPGRAGASPSSTSASTRAASWTWVSSDAKFTAEPHRDAP